MQYIGYYDEEVEAAKAYDRAILKFRGPGHHINFPEGQYTAEEIASAPKVEPQVSQHLRHCLQVLSSYWVQRKFGGERHLGGLQACLGQPLLLLIS